MNAESWIACIGAVCVAVLTVWGHAASRGHLRRDGHGEDLSGFSPTIADCASRPLVDRRALSARHRS